MSNNVLVQNSEQYEGQYVATRSFKDRKAVCSGTDPVEVYNQAKEQGVRDPVIQYIPKKNMVHVY